MNPNSHYSEDKFRIDICGGIASGKTTLASLYESPEIYAIYEDFKRSPFWEAFYTHPGKYIFETEISFILLHYHQIKKALENIDTQLICDFSFLLDHAYAKMGLFGSQLNTFEYVLAEIKNELPQPDLYIYLECNADTQLERIQNRKRPEESQINIEFLDSLNKVLKLEIDKVDNTKVITINSAEKDFANSKSVQSELVDLITDILLSSDRASKS